MASISVVDLDAQRLDEAASLFDAYRQFYGQPEAFAASRAFLSERLKRNESVVMLGLFGGAAVGITQLYPLFSSIQAAPIWVLNDLFVLESHRGLGVGSMLLEAGVAMARDRGAAKLQLVTEIHNSGAQALYEREDWARDERYHHYELTLKTQERPDE